jgi:hypothetical protein
MAMRPKSDVPAETLARYEAVVAMVPGVERKGAAMPYTSMNGHMFSFVTGDGDVALRLPSPAREAFLAEHATRLCEQHGVVMKEYVVVPAALLARSAQLAAHFRASHAYVASLAPKATTRKPAAKKAPAKKAPPATRKASTKSTKKTR